MEFSVDKEGHSDIESGDADHEPVHGYHGESKGRGVGSVWGRDDVQRVCRGELWTLGHTHSRGHRSVHFTTGGVVY